MSAESEVFLDTDKCVFFPERPCVKGCVFNSRALRAFGLETAEFILSMAHYGAAPTQMDHVAKAVEMMRNVRVHSCAE